MQLRVCVFGGINVCCYSMKLLYFFFGFKPRLGFFWGGGSATFLVFLQPLQKKNNTMNNTKFSMKLCFPSSCI